MLALKIRHTFFYLGLVSEPTISNSGEGVSPMVIYAALGTCSGFIIILVVLAIALLKCRTTNVLVVENLVKFHNLTSNVIFFLTL